MRTQDWNWLTSTVPSWSARATASARSSGGIAMPLAPSSRSSTKRPTGRPAPKTGSAIRPLGRDGLEGVGAGIAHTLVRDLGKILRSGSRLEPALPHREQRDELTLHDPDQTGPPTLHRRRARRDGARARPRRDSRRPVRLAATVPDDELADDEPDDEQEHRGLDVVAAVDRERVVRTGEEEVEGCHRHERGDRAGEAAPEHGGSNDDEHQDERDVRRPDVAADRDEGEDDDDRPDERHDPGKGGELGGCARRDSWSSSTDPL